MSGDTVSDFAEKRQVNKQSLFQERRQGVVKVCELGKSPQVFCDLRIVGGESKEVRENSKSCGNSGLQLSSHIAPFRRNLFSGNQLSGR